MFQKAPVVALMCLWTVNVCCCRCTFINPRVFHFFASQANRKILPGSKRLSTFTIPCLHFRHLPQIWTSVSQFMSAFIVCVMQPRWSIGHRFYFLPRRGKFSFAVRREQLSTLNGGSETTTSARKPVGVWPFTYQVRLTDFLLAF